VPALTELMAHQLVLISGVPGTGNSTFRRWIEEQHGFVPVDIENDGLDRFRLLRTWQQFAHLPPTQCRAVPVVAAPPRPARRPQLGPPTPVLTSRPGTPRGRYYRVVVRRRPGCRSPHVHLPWHGLGAGARQTDGQYQRPLEPNRAGRRFRFHLMDPERILARPCS
jgi:hypothetical protein